MVADVRIELTYVRLLASFDTLPTICDVEPEIGLEPTTFRLQSDCSTIELLWHWLGRRDSNPQSIAYKAIAQTI